MLSNIRAHQIMLGNVPDQRRQSRVQLPVSAHVFAAAEVSHRHVAHLRDLNILGAFFYSNLPVAVGDAVRVELTPLQAMPNLNVKCEANVVRVEDSPLKGFAGIAVEFHNFMVEEPTETRKDHVTTPFANWPVNKVDEEFARRPELQTYAERIQGAA